MKKKLISLVACPLTALVLAALPAGASGSTMTAKCSGALPCVGTVESTGASHLTQDSGLGIICNKTTGTVTQSTSPTTTVTVVLTFDECHEVFGNECNNEGAGTARIETPSMTGDLITVTANNKKAAGILITNVNLTFKCPTPSLERTVTGSVIGTFEESEAMCGVARTHHTVEFAQGGTGIQNDKTYTGNTFNLTSGPHLGDGTESSQKGTVHITYEAGKTVTINC